MYLSSASDSLYNTYSCIMRQSRQKQAAVEKSLSRPSCASATQLGNAQWLFGGIWNKALFFKKKSKYTGTAWVRQRFFHGCLFLSGLSYYARISIVKRVKGWAKLHTYWESRLNWKNLCLNQAVPVPLKLVMHTGCISDEIKPYLKKNFWFISD